LAWGAGGYNPAMPTTGGNAANAREVQVLWTRAERSLAARARDAARADYEALLQLAPGHAGALLRLSTLATAEGRVREAVRPILSLAADPPADPDLLLMLAGTLHRLGEAAAARACLRHSAWRACRDRDLLERAAQVAADLEDFEAATSLLEAAETMGGTSSATWYARATQALFAGRLDAAEAALQACLALAPGHAPAHWALARLRRQTPASNHVGTLRARLAQARDGQERAYLGFALFKELDDLDDVDGAWAALVRGCEEKRALLAGSANTASAAADEAAAFDALHELWPVRAEATSPRPGAGAQLPGAPTPIFIVGMPRTGTTLLERIVTGAEGVADAGELDDIPLQLRWIADRFARTFLDAGVFRAAHAALRRDPGLLGRRYLGHAAWRAQGQPWFTDKLPLNALHVGFIAEALPAAPILHMVRDPMDTCFSNLKELFNEAYPYSYSLDALATHYGRYRRLMATWHARFPGRILDVPYEGLVADPEAWARRILAHCGLPWDPRCLDVAGRASAVTTASSVQVREPIHGRGVGGWRRYAAQLEPLRERLARDGWLPPAASGAAPIAPGRCA
jgi:tetratricopeptide (TPR) repeat protein